MFEQNPNLVNAPQVFKKKWYKRRMALLLFAIIFIILIFLTAFGFKVYSLVKKIERGEINFTPVSQIKGNLEEGTQTFKVSADNNPFFGPSGAKVTIIAFEDFECPASKESFPAVKDIISHYGNKIHFVFRDFPLSDIHPSAEKAHEAASCANDQGGFWPMYDKLFQNQSDLTAPALKKYADEIGLDAAIFAQCLDSGKYEKEVERDLADGIAAGVRGTPTWFINGRKFEGSVPLETFKQIIDLSLGVEK